MRSGLVDFHCHLDLDPDHAAAVERCERDGVFTLTVTTTPKAWPRNHELASATDGKGLPARVVGAHRLADRMTLELQAEGQEKLLELDLVATPGLEPPAVGSRLTVAPLAWKVFPSEQGSP